MTSISSSDHRLPVSKKRLKPLMLRDFLLDDLSSCLSNGFKSFPRLLNTEIKRSGMFHHNRRITCGLAFTHAVHKASTALLTAVKLLPFPSSVKYPSCKRDNKKGLFSRSFWKKLPRRELNVDGENERKTEDREQEIQRCRSFAEFLRESQDQPSDLMSCFHTTDSFSGEATLSNDVVGDSSSFSSENSEATQKKDKIFRRTQLLDQTIQEQILFFLAIATFLSDSVYSALVVMRSGDCVGSHVSDGSSLNDNTEVNEKKLMRKSRRFESLVRLEPVDLEKRIEQYVERQDYNSHIIETEGDQSEIRANRLFALVKSRIIEERNQLLASHVVDNVLLDFFKENGNNETRDEDKLVKIVEEWVMRKQDEEYIMFMSWEVREKREIYTKEMKWGCINGDEKEYVVEELGNGFFTSLIDELIHDLSL
ncbi:unnamed protein product [Arabidopsis lyrata]|uniref:DUF4378 domain-containing protein n=1 Tax=Arabidopsis lyrata subsp. lyrata TaxID=81972 RepID=D7MDX9_ARALL|nr:hypothetical protein ARALYDRAFT_492563 [Arabidopsis lyrata subsp. lyrata]CAH8275652.1 unnamed protein product [Arabidopsis lyrata]